MSSRRVHDWSRREFLKGVSLAGTAALLGLDGDAVAAEPPETTKLRLARASTACWAPLYLAEELLRSEGFTDVQYVRSSQPDPGAAKMLVSGQVDIAMGAFGKPGCSLTRRDFGSRSVDPAPVGAS